MLMDEESGLIPGKSDIFLFFTTSRRAVRLTKLPIERTHKALSPVVKRLEREADYSSAPCAELKNTWIYTFISLYVFVTWWLRN
jgi:hypothetical protein